ncbi:hypothetical protein RFI_28712 [Reticulomyxa filosa]|uniref:Uncharacterized protein n=1 Tax=Reticulomyxa filosa TaxID=46433 RepID=X6M4V6_RETFI|nr:hypothetical protein RFI_28712 [Reticulomyxa filosa]|eukprot:ETO08676.1 hypothetical protein RFI_28712 [Reticulomyxa filosa]
MSQGIKILLAYCKQQESVFTQKGSKHLVKFDILRIKNGYKAYVDDTLKKIKNSQTNESESKNDSIIIPERLSDIKFNIIVTLYDENMKPISLIGEIQILLKRMLQHKNKIHELYEIERIENFFTKCLSKMKSKSIEKKILMAGIRSSFLSPLIVNHPIEFQEFLIKNLQQSIDQMNN